MFIKYLEAIREEVDDSNLDPRCHLNPSFIFFLRIVTRVDKDFTPKDCSSAKLKYCARGLNAAKKSNLRYR